MAGAYPAQAHLFIEIIALSGYILLLLTSKSLYFGWDGQSSVHMERTQSGSVCLEKELPSSGYTHCQNSSMDSGWDGWPQSRTHCGQLWSRKEMA